MKTIENSKSRLVGTLLGVFFGPLGLLYTSFLSFIFTGIILPIFLGLLILLISNSTPIDGPSLAKVVFFGLLVVYPIICGITAFILCGKRYKTTDLISPNLRKKERISIIEFLLLLLFFLCLGYAFYDIFLKQYFIH